MKLLELRKQKNKSQQEMAELLEIKQHSYSQYENGYNMAGVVGFEPTRDGFRDRLQTTKK